MINTSGSPHPAPGPATDQPVPAAGESLARLAAPHGGSRLLMRLSPSSCFAVSAVFHYLGPSFAVLLFTLVDVLGVA
jgi:inner membrane transporter RhtA